MGGRHPVLNAPDWTIIGGTDGTTMTTARKGVVGMLVKALRSGSLLKLGGGEAAIPLDGLTAALLRIDDRQGRAGGVTALVRTGPQLAALVRPVPSIPKVPMHPITARLLPAEAETDCGGARPAKDGLRQGAVRG